MATEEELFVKLLNNEEADKVLKMLNENIKSNNINLKRMRLKKIFRTGSSNMTKKKINPFDFVLRKCSKPIFKKFNDMELFKVFC
ncbi:hypothetical protein Z969_03930 [Clostridium novyi A str. 4570]|uniref:Uncharacterized protein n=1 Tax=Clostridium novyi A str. 4570 TaxID=1444290 RepID=A0AA88ZS86_CLONO|nr:hypothetical protein [Clostridium novyi]KGN02647.1 hypothetical protein Z969_03930 [Clostridium novyi A str. 4570]